MDSNLLYQFRMNFRRRRRLMELLTEKSLSPSKEIKIVSAVRRSSMSSCGSSGYFSSSPTLGSSPPVCQFVISVNGLNVLHADYRTVSNLILTGPRTIVMEVMEEIEP
ncbi:DEP domain-containing mTOR-interacting protein, partial [Ophiophagus hannah]